MTRGEINAIMPPERTNMDLLPASVKQLHIVQIGDRVTCALRGDPCQQHFRTRARRFSREEIQREGNTTILVST